jgi:hypothetical protein
MTAGKPTNAIGCVPVYTFSGAAQTRGSSPGLCSKLNMVA